MCKYARESTINTGLVRSTYRVMAPRYEKGIPIKKVKHPPIKHPSVAVRGLMAAMHRTWKSRAAKLPNPKMIIVAQFQKMALGNGVSTYGSVICLPKTR